MKGTILLLRVFEENYKMLYKIVHSITRNTEDTLDILQETFLTAYTRYNSHRSKTDTLKLLITISQSTANSYKKRGKAPDSPDCSGKATDAPALAQFLQELKSHESVVPIDIFNQLMINIIGGVPLLEVSRKSKVPYTQLLHWKSIILKDVSQRIKGNTLT